MKEIPIKFPTTASLLFLTLYVVDFSNFANEEDKVTLSFLNHEADIIETVIKEHCALNFHLFCKYTKLHLPVSIES